MRTISRRWAIATLAIAASATAAASQQQPGPPAQRNAVCVRLEAQLSQFDQGQTDPQRLDQIRRYEEAANRQQVELDRVAAEANRLGCEGRGFFSIFGGQAPQCGPLNNQMQKMRTNLDRVLSDLERLRGNTTDREGERRAILASLGQNDCGPQYRQFANRGGGSGGGGGFFEQLFGGGTVITPNTPPVPDASGNATFRTVCVRTCDGYYFPISFSTTQASFPRDEQVCQRLCPAAEVALYSHRNPGEDMSQAVSTSGQNYSELPNAFAFRKALNPSCSCRAPGQTWADALRNLEDNTVENGDIIVTEEQAKRLSQPTESKGKNSPKGKNEQPKADQPKAETTPVVSAPPAQPAQQNGGKKTVRTVGPPFLPSN